MAAGEGRDGLGGILTVRLAEYQAMRAEVHYRTQAQVAVLSLNVTAAGIVGSLALSGSGGGALILVLPYLCSALSMSWLDHARSISNVMAYCYQLFEHLFDDVVGPYTPPDDVDRSWEHFLRKRSREDGLRHRLTIAGPCAAVFVLPALVALAAGWTTLHSRALFSAVWGIGAAMTLANIVWWSRIRFVKHVPGGATGGPGRT